MVPLNDLGKILVFVGLGMVLLGGLLWSGRGWLSRLPGDIYYAKGHFTFSMPIVTCLLLSLILSLIAWIFRR